MSTSPDPVDTVERFAHLSALLTDPFADRAAVLREAGLDAAGWEALVAVWQDRLEEAGEDGELVGRYEAVFRETMRSLSSDDLPPTLPSPPVISGSGAQLAS